jgi:predicted nucleotidyltransferase
MSIPHTLSSNQRALVQGLLDALEQVPGFQGAVLGGSYARGRARVDSDIDLGVYYSEASPLCVRTIRGIANQLDGSVNPIVSELFEWGPWVNGGAWLTIHGQRVDLIYRSLEHVERVISDAANGKYELHFGQQPPFGYFSPTYLGELSIAVVLLDPWGHIAGLKSRLVEYPEALRRQVVQDYLWSVEFALHAFAPKFAMQGEVFLTASTIARCIHALVLVLFALNRRYLLNDKTALLEVSDFPLRPRDFRKRVEALLSSVGARLAELEHSVSLMNALFEEVVALSGDLYSPKYDLSKIAT